MLLKAIDEAANAPSPIMAAEMAVIRLCYVQELPTAAALLQRLIALPPSVPEGHQSAPSDNAGKTASSKVAEAPVQDTPRTKEPELDSEHIKEAFTEVDQARIDQELARAGELPEGSDSVARKNVGDNTCPRSSESQSKELSDKAAIIKNDPLVKSVLDEFPDAEIRVTDPEDKS